jgi:hypothetical protein
MFGKWVTSNTINTLTMNSLALPIGIFVEMFTVFVKKEVSAWRCLRTEGRCRQGIERCLADNDEEQ